MRISPERLARATTRSAVALATASLVALLALALAMAPTAPVEALAVAGQSWIPGEIPADPADRGLPGAPSPEDGEHDDGDDAAVLQAGVVPQASARRAGPASARRRGGRLAVGTGPRGPPAG